MFVRHRCCGREFQLEWKSKGYEWRPFLWDQGEGATALDLVTSCPGSGCALGTGTLSPSEKRSRQHPIIADGRQSRWGPVQVAPATPSAANPQCAGDIAAL